MAKFGAPSNPSDKIRGKILQLTSQMRALKEQLKRAPKEKRLLIQTKIKETTSELIRAHAAKVNLAKEVVKSPVAESPVAESPTDEMSVDEPFTSAKTSPNEPSSSSYVRGSSQNDQERALRIMTENLDINKRIAQLEALTPANHPLPHLRIPFNTQEWRDNVTASSSPDNDFSMKSASSDGTYRTGMSISGNSEVRYGVQGMSLNDALENKITEITNGIFPNLDPFKRQPKGRGNKSLKNIIATGVKARNESLLAKPSIMPNGNWAVVGNDRSTQPLSDNGSQSIRPIYKSIRLC